MRAYYETYYETVEKMERPKNGVPQLWISFWDDFEMGSLSLHIIYPDGIVEFYDEYEGDWHEATASRRSQKAAIAACHKISDGMEEFVCNIE